MVEEKKYGTKAIEENQLETFVNRFPDNDYLVCFDIPEFTCLCPRSGFPDFATIRIRYVPDQRCVELKSLKLYINGFRNKNIYHEDVANVIIDELIGLLDPRYIFLQADFMVRGNIHTTVEAEHIQEGFDLTRIPIQGGVPA